MFSVLADKVSVAHRYSYLICFLLAVAPSIFMGTDEVYADQQQSLEENRYNISSLPKLFANVAGSVVSIDVESDEFAGSGSGFIYDHEGHIITNNHVVEGSTFIDVTFLDGLSFPTELIGTDPYSDLAVLQIDSVVLSKYQTKPLPLANSSNVRVGEQVVAIGNPHGLKGTMTYGIISQVGRDFPEPGTAFSIPDIIQIDADINPGNSGGPLFNFNGEVIGVNSGGIVPAGGSIGLNFAIASNTVQKVIPALIENGSYKHPWLGINGKNISPSDQRNLGLQNAKGVILLEVFPNTSASTSGLQRGDIVTAIDSKEVMKISDVLSYIDSKQVGETVLLKILRDGFTENVSVLLIERPVYGQIRIIDR